MQLSKGCGVLMLESQRGRRGLRSRRMKRCASFADFTLSHHSVRLGKLSRCPMKMPDRSSIQKVPRCCPNTPNRVPKQVARESPPPTRPAAYLFITSGTCAPEAISSARIALESTSCDGFVPLPASSRSDIKTSRSFWLTSTGRIRSVPNENDGLLKPNRAIVAIARSTCACPTRLTWMLLFVGWIAYAHTIMK